MLAVGSRPTNLAQRHRRLRTERPSLLHMGQEGLEVRRRRIKKLEAYDVWEEQEAVVVNVRGIFRKTTDRVTTKANIRLVETMVRGYTENHRSVMLTVIPCNVDIATQDILTVAEDVDSNGCRTLGVLTNQT